MKWHIEKKHNSSRKEKEKKLVVDEMAHRKRT